MLLVLNLVAAAVAATVVVTGATALPPHHPRHHAPSHLIKRIAGSNPQILDGTRAIKPLKGLRVTPAQFGGDPTGFKDSWAAVNAALNSCLNQSAKSPNGFFPGEDSTPSFGPIRDMGGCFIDLDGGEYRISQTLTIPEMNANMQLGFGSLVATKDFSGDFMIVVGVEDSCRVPQGSCNIDINFPELFLDGARSASGMQINHVMGTTIGPGGYFLNFTQYGLQINGGHEVMMDRCWLGETNFDFDHEKMNTIPNATAIQINGNDHYILNTIVFSSRIGLEVSGAADVITGTHVWFPVNHAVYFPFTAAFLNHGGGNRFVGCYMDGGRAIFTGGAAQKTIWTDGFECCQGARAAPNTSASGITVVGDSIGPGLQISNNIFGGGSVYHCSAGDYAAGTCGAQLLPDAYRTKYLPRLPAFTNCSSIFNLSSANRDCIGLHPALTAKTLEECSAACCADSACSVYQFCPVNGNCDGASQPANTSECWLGSASKCTNGQRQGWQGMEVGGARPPTPAVVTGTRIEHNSFSSNAQASRATMSLTQSAATKWSFDFCDELLFPVIVSAKVHVMAESGFPVAVARPTKNCTLLVETSEPVTGTLTVEVDSSTPSTNFQ